MAKGIRINALAKELGVESKSILAKCRDEGLGDKVPNHMSVVTLGLAETIREWFSGMGGEGGGTAVETAPPVEATKTKARPKAKKKKTDEELEAPPATDEAPPAPPVETVVREVPAPAPEPVFVPPPAPIEEIVPPAPAPVEPQVEEIPAIAAEAPEPVAPPAPSAPAAPGVARSGGRAGVAHDPNRPPALRQAVTLESIRQKDRPAITPPPQVVPRKAELAGPKVIREEKPDPVSAPRPRRPVGESGPPAPGIGTVQRGGRGVKTDDEEGEKKGVKGGRTLSQRRRGTDGRRGEAMEKLKEFSEQDLIDRQIRLNAAAASRASFDSHLKKTQGRGTHAIAKTGVERGEPIGIEEPITVKSLSAALGIKTNDIIKKLMAQGVFATQNQSLDADAAAAIALEYGIELQIAQKETLEEELMTEFDTREVDAAELKPRPPVVTILGHVDHGKTSLLDKIRNANVAAGEAGGITQHTAAWVVSVGEGETKKQVTFIDTPGHHAFTKMRARGADMTDVVVLVVGAVEGVMPQTIESINHARAAEKPIVVALNKIDRADANPDMVLGQLAAQGLNPIEYGGTTEVVRTSATTGQGIKELIEILDYQAELLELKANPSSPARGSVIESKMDAGLGAIATVLVQDGTLRVGDVILSGPGYGRIRALYNDRGESIQEALPSTPVIVSGLNELPGAGDMFYVVDDFDRARSIATERATLSRQSQLAQANRVTNAGNLLETIAAGDVKTINLIIKGDVQGSVETLVATVTGQNTEEVKVRVIHSGVGAVSESDVQLAMATKTKPTDNRVAIIGFNVVPEEQARALAEQNHVDVKTYRVIYEIFDDLKKALSGMLTKEVREKLHGHVEIRQVFKVSKVGNIAGCFVTDGHIQRGSHIRLIRDGKIITEGLRIETLRRVKDDVREVKAGLECGIKLLNYDDIKIGDVLEGYITEEFERTL